MRKITIISTLIIVLILNTFLFLYLYNKQHMSLATSFVMAHLERTIKESHLKYATKKMDSTILSEDAYNEALKFLYKSEIEPGLHLTKDNILDILSYESKGTILVNVSYYDVGSEFERVIRDVEEEYSTNFDIIGFTGYRTLISSRFIESLNKEMNPRSGTIVIRYRYEGDNMISKNSEIFNKHRPTQVLVENEKDVVKIINSNMGKLLQERGAVNDSVVSRREE